MAIPALAGVIIGGLLFGYSFIGQTDKPVILAIGGLILMGSFVWGLTGAKLPER